VEEGLTRRRFGLPSFRCMRESRGVLRGVLLCLALGCAAGRFGEAREPWGNDAPNLSVDLPESSAKGGVYVHGKGKEKPKDQGPETEYGMAYTQREFSEYPVRSPPPSDFERFCSGSGTC
jgi:hypothetical protein